MRGTAFRTFLVSVTVLCLASAAATQPKPKDPVAYTAMMDQFNQLAMKIQQLGDRMTALEQEIGKLKQLQTDFNADLRSSQTMLKTNDTQLSTLRLDTQQGFFGLKADMAQLRSDMSNLASAVKNAAGAATMPGTTTPAPSAALVQVPEGYISEVTEKTVIISLGGKHGVTVGMRFGVFKSNDARTRVGIVKIIEVVDDNNSKAEIVDQKPDVRFEFSDIVRPL